jgi:HEAT repeat protein
MHSTPCRLPGLALALLVCGSAAGLPPKPIEDPDLNGKKLSAWVADLRDKHAAVRRAATAALEGLPGAQKGRPLTPESRERLYQALAAALDDTDATVRFNAATLPSAHWPGTREKEKVVAILLDGFGSPDAAVRAKAATKLPRVEPQEKVALAPLSRLLKDPDETVRISAASALSSIQPRRAVVPALIAALKDESSAVRTSAVAGLGVKSMAETVVPPILVALKDPAKLVRWRALVALGDVGDQKLTLMALIAALKDPAAEVRCLAAEMLAEFGPAAKAALPALLDLWKGTDRGGRSWALNALVAIDPDGDKTLAALISALGDKHEGIRLQGIRHCWEQGTKAKAAVPALLEHLKDKSQAIRDKAAAAVKQIDPEAAKKAGLP